MFFSCSLFRALACVYLLSLILFTTQINSDPQVPLDDCDDSCDYCLTNVDFEQGTVRATVPGTKYCLGEDIVFNPRPCPMSAPNALGCWFPTNNTAYPGCETNSHGPYALGFFAAFTVEVDDIELDLNGKTFEEHPHMYLQQRFYAHIQISRSVFEFGFGPASFVSQLLNKVSNVYIHNGNLGLAAHHAIHSNNAANVVLADLNIFDFEVGGIQMNSVENLTIRDCNVGPSLRPVPVFGYYSNSRFLMGAYRMCLDFLDTVAFTKTITFAQGTVHERTLSYGDIANNLERSMDIYFRHLFGASTADDLNDDLYEMAMRMYVNPFQLPDGSAVYGILLHSFGYAVDGFDSRRNGPGDGNNVRLSNIRISDLRMNVNSIPVIYFDECRGSFDTYTISKGAHGEILDLRKMVGLADEPVIDSGADFTSLVYVGNVLSDGQLSLAYLLSTEPELVDESYITSLTLKADEYLLDWAVGGISLPACAKFMCNGDIMFHTNKGVIGLRLGLIEDVSVSNLVIENLRNESPFASCACGNYSGRHDGGNVFQPDREGFLGSDVRGVSIFKGDVYLDGEGDNAISNLVSFSGDVTGIHLMTNASLFVDENARLRISRLRAGTAVKPKDYERLLALNKTPYPNNFKQCNILVDEDGFNSLVFEADEGDDDGDDDGRHAGARNGLRPGVECTLPRFVTKHKKEKKESKKSKSNSGESESESESKPKPKSSDDASKSKPKPKTGSKKSHSVKSDSGRH